jgi:DNA-directed RNA polymerase specialized sigma24 family protein
VNDKDSEIENQIADYLRLKEAGAPEAQTIFSDNLHPFFDALANAAYCSISFAHMLGEREDAIQLALIRLEEKLPLFNRKKGSRVGSWAYALILNFYKNLARANGAKKRRKDEIALDNLPPNFLGSLGVFTLPDSEAESDVKREFLLEFWRVNGRKYFKGRLKNKIVCELLKLVREGVPTRKFCRKAFASKLGTTHQNVSRTISQMAKITKLRALSGNRQP